MAKLEHFFDDTFSECVWCGVKWSVDEEQRECNSTDYYVKQFKAQENEKGATKMGNNSSFGAGYWDDKAKKFVYKGDKEWKEPSQSSLNSGWGGGSYKSKCLGHNGTAVLDFNGLLVAGYKKGDLPPTVEKTLIVNLTGYAADGVSWPLKKFPETLKVLDDKDSYGIAIGDEMLIDWPDGKGVAISPQWWLKLLQVAKEAGYVRMNVCCIGGHGRTGTALAALLIAANAKGIKNGDEAVSFVRKAHCAECIESDAQLNYIDLVCDYYKKPRTTSKSQPA